MQEKAFLETKNDKGLITPYYLIKSINIGASESLQILTKLKLNNKLLEKIKG